MSEVDIRLVLQKAEEGSRELDRLIHDHLVDDPADPMPIPHYSTSYDISILEIARLEIDWMMDSINGHVGGTTSASCASTVDNPCHSGTPLLALWLAVFRELMGDERMEERSE